MLIAADPAAGGTNILGMIWPLILMFAVFYVLLIRPQQKRSKSRTSMLSTVKKGDKVVTIGGLHGTVMEITSDTMILRVNDATKMTFDRSAINSVTPSTTVTEE
jgi:preprotein translocase subunit YajC